jgi:5'-3' exonuclease
MGIKNLNKFLRNKCPDVYEHIHLSEYSFKKIAVDVSLYLCKFKSIAGDKWLSLFINLIACLRKNEVHCVFCYDNGSPPEKEAEKKERADQRAKTEEKVYKLEEAIEKFNLTNEIDPILIEFYKKKTKSDKIHQRLLGREDNNIDMNFIISSVEKMRSQILQISSDDFLLTKKLFDILEVPYYDAPLEAETSCADLCKRGIVDAVLSEDTDVLAYGAPVFLSKINTYDGTCVRIKYPDLLQQLSLNDNQFLDLCIMCGTDYNKNIFRIGPEKAYKYIQTHTDIDGISENTKIDISVLNHERGRQLFREYEQKDIKVLFCGSPDFEKLTEFVFKNNLNINIEGLKKCFIHSTTIIFEESDEEQYEFADDKDDKDDKDDLSIKIESSDKN